MPNHALHATALPLAFRALSAFYVLFSLRVFRAFVAVRELGVRPSKVFRHEPGQTRFQQFRFYLHPLADFVFQP